MHVEPESSTVVRSAVENSPSAVLLCRSRSRVFFSCSLSRDTFLFFGGGGAKLNVTLLNVALPALKRKPLADGEFVMSELAELPRVGGEDVGEMKFNLLPVGIGDGVLVFHRCLQTLSLLFLQEAIEDGVGSLELRVRENVYGHGRRKPALNRCFSGHIRIAAVHVTTFRPDVHEIAFQDFSDLFLRQCQKVGHILRLESVLLEAA